MRPVFVVSATLLGLLLHSQLNLQLFCLIIKKMAQNMPPLPFALVAFALLPLLCPTAHAQTLFPADSSQDTDQNAFQQQDQQPSNPFQQQSQPNAPQQSEMPANQTRMPDCGPQAPEWCSMRLAQQTAMPSGLNSNQNWAVAIQALNQLGNTQAANLLTQAQQAPDAPTARNAILQVLRSINYGAALSYDPNLNLFNSLISSLNALLDQLPL
jgi:hypothetical protein